MGWVTREIEKKILTQLHNKKTRSNLKEIHTRFIRHGLNQSNKIISHFISVCRSKGKMRYAELIFEQTHHPDLLVFNSMIKGYSLLGPFDKPINLYNIMRGCGIWPNEFTLVPLIKSSCYLYDLRVGRCVHSDVIKHGFDRCGVVRVGVVELYVSFEEMGNARKVFDEMSKRDVIVWNLMIKGYCKVGDVNMGLFLFRRMRERSIVSWNSIISSLAKCGRDSEALGLFHQMRVDGGFEPDEATVVSVLPVCARLGAVDVGKWLHSYAQSSGLFREFVTVGNSIVNFYCKCGDMGTANRVFHEMPRKNVISWNALISGLAYNGKGLLGVELFEEMISKGIVPNDSTFVGVLACCAQAKLFDKGREFFSSMMFKHKILPKLEHYGCMADLLGRSGCVKEAFELIKSMPMKPNAALWGSLLSSSRTFGDKQLAEYAAKELISLEPWNSGNYVLLSNIYAEEGRWDEVDKLRFLMKENSVIKSTGCSAVG